MLKDSLNREVHARLGSIAPDRHLRHETFHLWGGHDDPARIIEADSVESMILWGDMTRALEGQPPLRQTERLEYTHDEHGRLRVKIVWQDGKP